MTHSVEYSMPEIGDYVKMWEDWIFPTTNNFAIVSGYCWSEADKLHGTIYIVVNEDDMIMPIVRFPVLDTYQHRGWLHVTHRIDDRKFRQYLNDKKEK